MKGKSNALKDYEKTSNRIKPKNEESANKSSIINPYFDSFAISQKLLEAYVPYIAMISCAGFHQVAIKRMPNAPVENWHRAKKRTGPSNVSGRTLAKK